LGRAEPACIQKGALIRRALCFDAATAQDAALALISAAMSTQGHGLAVDEHDCGGVSTVTSR